MDIVPHDNCQKCQLFQDCKTPYMQSHGAKDPLVLVIGEAPGESEDKQGRPFVGRSGQLLRQVLTEIGFEEDDIRYTNVVRCRPPENKISKRHINYCSHYVIDEIEHYNPELVLLMGNSPLNAILGESGITTWNGVVVEREDRTYVPLYHPAYLLRNMNAMGDWLDGFSRALDTLGVESENNDWERIFPRTLYEVKQMREHLAQFDFISYDTEVTRLDAHSRHNVLLVVSFAAGGKAYAVACEHPESQWSFDYDNIGRQVMDVIIDIIKAHDGKLIGHNMKFDQQHTRKLMDVDYQVGGDTMLVSHLLDSRQGIHSLKRLAGLYLGMYDYDRELQEYTQANPEADPRRGGDYAAIPLSILLPYAAMDAEATIKLHDKLYPQLSKQQQILYEQMILPVSDVLADIEYNGIAVDSYIARRYRDIYKLRQEEVYEDIETDKYVSKMSKERGNGYKFNPNSSQQVAELLHSKKYYRIPVQAKTPAGKPSTSASALKAISDDYEIIKTIRYYKLLTKMIGTYLEPACGDWISHDKRVHSTYNLHGTRTGRLSSSNPNLQNIPTPEKEEGTLLETLPIKNVFTHSFKDGVLMSVDYSGMELRVFASMAKCYPMIDIHKSGQDFHSTVAVMAMTGKQVADVTLEEIAKLPKPVRYRYKWTNWTLLYGGGASTLISLYGMSPEEANHTVKTYYDTFPEVLDYRQYCEDFAFDNGYIESPFGRREHLAYIRDRGESPKKAADKRAAVNMPIQSGASDTLLCALIIIHAKMKERGMKSLLVNTVHDSIVIDCHPDEIEEVAGLCVTVMENIQHYAAEYMPDVSFDWLICPLKADVEVGTHYGAEVDYHEWKQSIRSIN